MPEDASPPLRCSFCSKSQRDVKKLIAGPNVFICDECIETCNEILADDGIVVAAGLNAAQRAARVAEQYLDAAKALIRAGELHTAALEIRNAALATLRGLLHLGGESGVNAWSETKVTVMALDTNAAIARLLQVDDPAHVILRVSIHGAHFTEEQVVAAANVAENLIALLEKETEAAPRRA